MWIVASLYNHNSLESELCRSKSCQNCTASQMNVSLKSGDMPQKNARLLVLQAAHQAFP